MLLHSFLHSFYTAFTQLLHAECFYTAVKVKLRRPMLSHTKLNCEEVMALIRNIFWGIWELLNANQGKLLSKQGSLGGQAFYVGSNLLVHLLCVPVLLLIMVLFLVLLPD